MEPNKGAEVFVFIMLLFLFEISTYTILLNTEFKQVLGHMF